MVATSVDVCRDEGTEVVVSAGISSQVKTEEFGAVGVVTAGILLLECRFEADLDCDMRNIFLRRVTVLQVLPGYLVGEVMLLAMYRRLAVLSA